MKEKLLLQVYIFVFILIFNASFSQAEIITIVGTGSATHTSEDQGVLNPFTANDSISLSFSYDSETADLAPDTSAGRYQINDLRGPISFARM